MDIIYSDPQEMWPFCLSRATSFLFSQRQHPLAPDPSTVNALEIAFENGSINPFWTDLPMVRLSLTKRSKFIMFSCPKPIQQMKQWNKGQMHASPTTPNSRTTFGYWGQSEHFQNTRHWHVPLSPIKLNGLRQMIAVFMHCDGKSFSHNVTF